MGKVMYCEKCGNIYHIMFSKQCDFCNTKMKLLSKEMRKKYNIFTDNWSEVFSELRKCNTSDDINAAIEELISRENEFIINEVSNNPLFSIEDYEKQTQKNRQELYEHAKYHQKQISERQAKNLAQMQKEQDKINCVPKCPSCGSGNVSKIGVVNRSISVAMVGLASSKIGKTHKCNNCGTTW